MTEVVTPRIVMQIFMSRTLAIVTDDSSALEH